MRRGRSQLVFRLASGLALSLGCWGCVNFSERSSSNLFEANENSPAIAASPDAATQPAAVSPAIATNQFSSVSPAAIQLPTARMPEVDLRTFPRRPLALQEAVLLGLKQSDVVRTLSGAVHIEPITPLDPAIADAELRKEESRFDPRASAAYIGSQINQPPNSFFGPGIATNTRRDEANFAASLDKTWPLGTTTRIAYDPWLAYLYFPQGTSGGLNPAYNAATVFEVRQPLLRSGGWKVNVAPIRIAAAKVDQSQWEVLQATLAQFRSIANAYWNLHAALIALQSVETILPLAEEAVRIEQLRLEAQRSIFADVARASVNLENLRRQQSQLQLNVRQQEYNLRQLVGLPSFDGALLIPVDSPSQGKVDFDVAALVQTAYSRRPDLNRRRRRREEQEWRLVAARNGLMPQLDLRALYRTSGLDSRLDDSLDQMSSFNYTDWTLGMEFSVPLGNRRAKADVQSAELQLMRELALLRGYEEQVTFEFSSLLAELKTAWERYESAMRQVRHTQEWLRLARIRYSSPPAANRGDDWLLLSLYDYQIAMQSFIDAVSTASRSLADYNILLVRIDEAQGILLEKWQINFAEQVTAPSVQTPAPDLAVESGIGGHSPSPSPQVIGNGNMSGPAPKRLTSAFAN